MKSKKFFKILELIKKFISKVKSLSLHTWTCILIFIVIFVAISENLTFNKNIDFDKEYYIISEKQAQVKYKSNITSGKYTYYMPKGYNQISEDIFKNKNNYIQIIKADDSLSFTNGDKYSYNEDLDLVYDNSSIDSKNSKLLMKVWDMGNDMYELLLIDKSGNGVVADIPIVKFKEDIRDIANILNSIKLKGE